MRSDGEAYALDAWADPHARDRPSRSARLAPQSPAR